MLSPDAIRVRAFQIFRSEFIFIKSTGLEGFFKGPDMTRKWHRHADQNHSNSS